MKIIKLDKSNKVELKDIKIFICSPTLGKSNLATQNSSFIDIDRYRFKYKFELENNYENEETLKGSGELTPKRNIKEIFEYSKQIIEERLSNGKIILLSPPYIKEGQILSSKYDITTYIHEKGYQYCLIYFDISANSILANRIKKRGNSEQLINDLCSTKNSKIYQKYFEEDKRPAYKIIVDSDKYLSEIMQEIEVE